MARLISVSDLDIKTKVKPNGRGSVVVTCVATTFVFRQELGGAAVTSATGAAGTTGATGTTGTKGAAGTSRPGAPGGRP
jgi:hypothetical protein